MVEVLVNIKYFREKYRGYYWKVRRRYYRIVKRRSKILIGLGLLLAPILLYCILFWYPHHAVAEFNITNPKDLADTENSYRTTMAQILGGIAIGIGLYFTWKKVMIAQDSQITDRFTRAVEQLGASDQSHNKTLEIRLGGIYALERIARESDKDYWSIMEILTAYVRQNSPIKNSVLSPVSEDIQAVLTVIGRREYSLIKDVYALNLRRTNLQGANLHGGCLYGADLEGANLKEANLEWVKLRGSSLAGANLQEAKLFRANLVGAYLHGADFKEAKLQGADLRGANLTETINLTFEQLSEVFSLYQAKLDEELRVQLEEKSPDLFDPPSDS